LHRGKVRDVYDLGDDLLAMVASDRVSAFDVVMNESVPDKGCVLTLLSQFWFEFLSPVVANHVVRLLPDGRTTVVRRAQMLPVECIVRGYLSGSAWAEYQATGTVHGKTLRAGLQQSESLGEPLFCASTKAAVGTHDENITWAQLVELVGLDVAQQLEFISLKVFADASRHAADRGLILADTKFEFGYIDGTLALCDEVLTPDSSRFWLASEWQVGTTPASFDKQPLRDWLESTGWNKTPPPPPLPDDVVRATRQRYLQAYEMLVGAALPTELPR